MLNVVAKRTLQYHLHENGFKQRVQRKKLVIKEVNRKKKTVMVPGKAEIVGWKQLEKKYILRRK